MKKVNDTYLWNEYLASVIPLASDHKEADLPPRLKVKRAPALAVSYCLDLHQKTLQEAYQTTLSFIEKHYRLGSKQIQIITGKGREGKGAIRSEFQGWLDTAAFKKYIREWKWTNDKGAILLWFKKSK